MTSTVLSFAIRALLIVGSVLTFLYIMRYIRRSKVRIEDTFFWILLSALLVLLSIFPDIALIASEQFGMQSPINFVFLLIIFILIVKQFSTSLKLSQLEIRMAELTQQMAIDKKDAEDNAK